MIDKLFKFIATNKVSGPMQLVLFVTSLCNCRCQHCFYLNDLNTHRGLTIAEYNRIAASVGKLRTLCVTGGEPFLRKDIFDIINTFAISCTPKYLQIPTNGILTDAIIDTVENIINKLDVQVNISISLDGFEEIHNRIRNNKDCFQKALHTLHSLRTLSSSTDKFTVTVCTHLSTLTIHDLEPFCHYVKQQLKPDMHMFEIVRGDVADSSIKEIDKERLNEIYKFIRRYSDGYQKHSFFNKRERITGAMTKHLLYKQYQYCKSIFLGECKSYRCYAPSLSNVIYPDGSVSFCEGHFPTLKISDFNFNLNDLIRSQQYKESKLKALNCQCTNGMYQGYNTILNSIL